MQDHLNTTRRQLGELGAMAGQTEAMERKILERAEELLSEVEKRLPEAKAKSVAEPDAYMDLIEERGRLQQVIAQAKSIIQA